MADFALLDSPKLISRKIMKFPHCSLGTDYILDTVLRNSNLPSDPPRWDLLKPLSGKFWRFFFKNSGIQKIPQLLGLKVVVTRSS